MKQYKIEVANEAESKEAQELFFEMGYAWRSGGKSVQYTKNGYLFTSENYKITFAPEQSLKHFNESPQQQITLPELRTLAILNRNDVSDATHIGEDVGKWFVFCGKYYFFSSDGEWLKGNKALAKHHNLKPIQKKETEMSNLISGKEAKLAWANEQEVQVRSKGNDDWIVVDGGFCLSVFAVHDVEFRLKPQTITVTLELPKPFKPEVGDEYWFISPNYNHGYSSQTYDSDSGNKKLTQFGAYRTKEDVIKVVEAKRKAFGGAV